MSIMLMVKLEGVGEGMLADPADKQHGVLLSAE